MTKCPDCGRENVTEPMGHIVLCGRRVNDDWTYESTRERMSIADKCRRAGLRRSDGEQVRDGGKE